MYKLFYGILFLLLTSCTQRMQPAPVEELTWRPISKSQRYHTVKRGETLYAIAFRYDKDYRHLAAFNHLPYPYTLKVGQTLNLHFYTPILRNTFKPIQKRPIPYIVKPIRPVSRSLWHWPIKGKITSHFLPEQGKKGINIAGKKGDKILAAANGVVAYAGNGLSGYGNLIIIKHSNEFLTAYGNNTKNIVREGQLVKAGQVIGEIGIIDRKYWGVHFEIRKAGNPVNPLNYLQ